MIDWSKSPEWANYSAMDEDGRWWFFENRPKTAKFEWRSKNGRVECAHKEVHWKDSLSKRPEEK